MYSEQPQSFVVYGKESHGYRFSRQSAIGFRGSLKLGLVTEREHEVRLSIVFQFRGSSSSVRETEY